MRNRVRLYLCAMCVVIAGSMAAQEAVPTKEQRIRELLVVMRTDAAMTQMMNMMIGAMKQTMPDASEEYWTVFQQKAKVSDLVDLIVPIYAKHFETADIEEMIRFHRSPAGQRFLDKQPLLMQESMMVSQQWSAKILSEVMTDMKKTKGNE